MHFYRINRRTGRTDRLTGRINRLKCCYANQRFVSLFALMQVSDVILFQIYYAKNQTFVKNK